LPFDGEDWYSIARQHVEEPPPPPRSLNPALSPDLDGILLRCLAKKPEQRFASADELAERLEALRHPTTEITAARTLVMEPFPGPVGRRRRVLFASVGAAAVLAAGAAALYARNAAEDLPAPAVPPAVVDSGRVLALDTVTVVAQPLVDSAVVDSAVRAATVEPPKLGLAVSAPAGSEIWVNGQVVARGGSWTSDTLSAGSYTVVALLPLAADGCPSAREQQRVRLASTTRRRLVRSVSLAPRPCGTVEIRARTPEQVTATYEVSDGSTARPLTGQLPLARPLTLPVGSWRLVVKARQCAEYTEDFQVNEQSTKRIFAPMFCGKE
jgi:serine/threonine-protein kinase